ncbi:hypothetical protein BDP27DRAFT_1445087 [Rhodocollybia butyracea]|uniref:Uncharacterized protein n=1 Tax=Rhodocollybia butyracea TaxID=206335 RepID=A0A9P5UBJ5_9AGAR|nr:hypothetical protein BDP27DRAFT_1445087 [Rhodocollybia butyracea]
MLGYIVPKVPKIHRVNIHAGGSMAIGTATAIICPAATSTSPTPQHQHQQQRTLTSSAPAHARRDIWGKDAYFGIQQLCTKFEAVAESKERTLYSRETIESYISPDILQSTIRDQSAILRRDFYAARRRDYQRYIRNKINEMNKRFNVESYSPNTIANTNSYPNRNPSPYPSPYPSRNPKRNRNINPDAAATPQPERESFRTTYKRFSRQAVARWHNMSLDKKELLASIEHKRRTLSLPHLPPSPPPPQTKRLKRLARLASFTRIARYKPRKKERWRRWFARFKTWRKHQPQLYINGIAYKPHRRKGYYISNWVLVQGKRGMVRRRYLIREKV